MRLFLMILPLCLVTLAVGGEYGQRGVSTKVGNPNVFQQDRKIFFNDTYFFGQNGFFDAGDNLRLQGLETSLYEEKQRRLELESEVRALREELRTLNSRLNNILINGGGTNNLPPLNQGGLVLPNPEPPVENNREYEAEVANLFRQSCAKCHTEGRASGGLTLLTVTGNLADLSESQIEAIYKRTTYEPAVLLQEGLSLMPQGGQRLSLENRDLIKNWAKGAVLPVK